MKIYVVGFGPGGADQITPRALEALRQSDVIAGYDLYIELIKDMIEGKKLIQTPMKKEVDRCKLAIEEALKGHTVAMISSGDAGVYGMAGVIHELCADHPEIEIEVVAGITAACSGAAVMG
ncbi:MAG: precorrin-3B C(17)-methyltransferase, partial [Proteocatella sp.]